MKKFLQMIAFAVLLAVPWAAGAQNTLTTCDGTANNEYVPFYGYYADESQHNQLIYPADSLTAMIGQAITQMVFYIDQSAGNGSYTAADRMGTWTVSLGLTTATTLSGIDNSTSLTQVYQGYFDCSTGTLTLPFSDNYVYTGGNLLVDIQHADASWNRWYFLGVSATGASYCYNSQRNFLPKVTFSYSNPPSCIRPVSMTATNVNSDGLTLVWSDPMNTAATYSIDYWKEGGDTNTVTSTDTTYTFTGFDANSLYHFAVKAVCSATDESSSLTGSFATACAGSTCDLTIQVSGYAFSYYGANVQLLQNGVLLGSYNSNNTVQVCSTDSVVVKYHPGTYSNTSATVTIIDGGGVQAFSGNGTSDESILTTIGTPCPSCIPPTALTVMPDSNQIDFSWTPRSGASQFIVYLNDSVVSDNVSDTFYTFTGLPANTAFTVRVQSVCSVDDTSSIVSRSTRTACGEITLPYVVDFEDAEYNGAWYPCWDSVLHAGTDPSVNTTGAHASTYGMYLQANSSESYNLVVSPRVPTAGNNIYVRFWGYNTNTTWYRAGVMSNPYDTSTFIPLVDVVGNSWNEYEFRTDTVTGIDANTYYYVAWMAYKPGASSYGTQMGRFDDVYISEVPSCVRVSAIGVDTITDESITLTWVDGGNTGASYTVSYWSATSDTTTVTTTDTSYLFDNLSANTAYTFAVQVNCSSEDAETVTASFRTACGLTAIPYSEGFEDEGALSCWQMVNCASNTGRTTGNANSGNACFRFYYNTNPPQYLISPELTGTDAGVKVEFYYKQGTSYTETFQVGYSTTGDSAEAFVWGEVITASSSYQTFDAIYPAGTKYVAIKLLSNDQLYLYIDDINFMLPPNCMPVSQLTVDTATDASATIHWTAPENQNSFIVRLNDSIYFNTTDTFYTFSGLSQRTLYSVAVASDCSGDTSEWVSTSIITGCTAGECEITLTSTSDYASLGSYYASYSPQLLVMQNGAEVANVRNATDTVGVCTGMPVTVIYGGGSTSTYANPTATIVNGGDEEVFNGTTVSYTEGDTLAYMANACPSCLKPSGLIPSVVDSNQITFVWAAEAGIGYLVSFDGGAYTPNTTGVYTAYGLMANTLHTFAVKAVCSVGDTSNPRIVSVKTACGEMGLPYVESFEGDAEGDVPSCWTVVNDGYNGYPAIDDNGHTGSNSLTFVSSSSASAMIASSRIPLPGDSIKVSFWAYDYYGYGTLVAGVMTNPYVDSTFIGLDTVTATSYALYEFNTSTLDHDSSYYLAFRYENSSTYYYAKVDDITIMLDEGCMTPTNIVATPDSVNPNITVTWTNGGSLNAFVVQYREAGSTTWSLPQYTSTTSKTLTGLSYATTYEIRVGQLCGSDTLWAANVYGTTTCGLVNLPYVEIFDSPTGSLPPCWNYTNATYFHWNRWTTHAESSGDGELMAGQGSAGEAVILPEFYAPIIKLQITFLAKLGNVSEGDGMMIGAYNESTGTVEWLDTLTNAGQSRENFTFFSYNYLNYTGSGTRIAIGHSHNANDWGFALDSIVVIELSTCNPPENVEAHNTMYPNTADDVYFTWTVSNSGLFVPSEWQVYYDTIISTTPIDSVPESQLIYVDTTYYMPPINSLAEGAHYRFFVRSTCGLQHSAWVELQGGFATDEFWMNNVATFDTIVGCDFIIYDNGGPVAGYLHNSNSNLVIQAGEAGRELQLQGAFFSHGADANTFTVYDGIGTSGTVLYSRNNTNETVTIDSVLATSTTGAMTITFTSGYYAALGYELYIHCVGDASCTKPTNLQVEMTSPSTAYATWDSTGASFYRVYHHVNGDSVWNMNPSYTNSITLTGLPSDVMYDFYVVAYCSATDTSAPSIIRHFNTHWEAPCVAVSGLQVDAVTANSATISWTSTGTQWEVNLVGNGTPVATTSNPYTFTGLTANTEYKVLVRNVCDAANNRYSEWSDTLTFTTAEEMYTITVTSNNESWGTVTGGGTFANGATTVIKATANSGYRFVSWQDSDTNAERTIIVTGDATYTATFAAVTGIDDVVSTDVTLYPNPASAAVTIRGIEGECTVSVVDLNGREVYKATANNSLTIDLTGYAKGAYFVRITGERTAAIRKLIVK